MTKRNKQPQISTLKHPVQPIGFDKEGVIRFKDNKIVRHLLDLLGRGGHKFDLNDLGVEMIEGRWTKEDYTQLMQLIGYSVSGAGDLSRFSRSVQGQADEEARRLWEASQKATG